MSMDTPKAVETSVQNLRPCEFFTAAAVTAERPGSHPVDIRSDEVVGIRQIVENMICDIYLRGNAEPIRIHASREEVREALGIIPNCSGVDLEKQQWP